MTLDEFWDLIETTRLPDGWEHAERLAVVLSQRSVDDILAFGRHFSDLHGAAYRWDLWGAAYLIRGGCGDDRFMDFRTGLILRGREVYANALASPDSLADVPGTVMITVEAHIGPMAYEAKTGQDNYYDLWEERFPPESGCTGPEGEKFDFENPQEMQQRYPRLWASFY